MYYLLNQTNQIIAADEPLLALCGLSHIDELASKIILGDTTFDLSSEEKITINNDKTYAVSKTSLSSMLGDLTLVTIAEVDTLDTSTSLTELVPNEVFFNDISIDEPIKEKEETSLLDLESDLSFLKSDDEQTPILELQPDLSSTKSDDEIPLLDLDSDLTFLKSDDDREDLFLPIDTDEEILIDIETISQKMGVSPEDYNTFLDEYIDTALELESDLQSQEEETRINAIGTLSQLGSVLHLPSINDIIEKLSSAAKSSQQELIASFYNTLSRLTTQASKKEEETHFELFDMPLEEENQKEEKNEDVKTEKVASTTPVKLNSFGSINLDGIKPIYFDFQLEEAATDLSLPVELIEEFVNDFIEQARIETKNMLEAYEKGDLDAIQKIGHLLKGASSNLRINALSDTLYQIQFCEDSNQLEAFIKEYWAHFLSFEIQINALAK